MSRRLRFPPRSRWALVVGVAAVALLLGACGDPEEVAADVATPSLAPTTAQAPSEPTESTPSAGVTDPTGGPTDPTGGPTDPTRGPTSALAPCKQVWVDGADLPKPYKGCAEDETRVPPDPLRCSSGQEIIRYQDRFYAVAGGLIRVTSGAGLDQDKGYRSTIATCRG